MDRPTARRKRHANSTNSVTVAELQAKSTPAEQASVSAIQARAAAEAHAMTAPMRITVDGAEFVEEPVAEQARPDEVVDEPRVSSRLAMTIVAMVVAMAACGAVTAVAAIGGERPHRLSPGMPAIQPTLITGANAVRMDVILDELTKGTAGGQPVATGATTSQQPREPLADHDVASQVVIDFYESVATRRGAAHQLLGPTMQGDNFAGFDKAWRDTRAAQPVILPGEDDDEAVLAEVQVERLTEGNFYVLVVRVEVRPVNINGTLLPRIVDAQLLSAHRG